MYLLDTNVISEGFAPRPDGRVIDWLEAAAPGDLYVSAIVKAELLFGVAVLPSGRRRDELAAMIASYIGRYEPEAVLAFTTNEAQAYADIVAARRALGRPIRELDAQVAAIARSRGLAVVTRNVKDFESCGVVVVNPWEAAP